MSVEGSIVEVHETLVREGEEDGKQFVEKVVVDSKISGGEMSTVITDSIEELDTSKQQAGPGFGSIPSFSFNSNGAASEEASGFNFNFPAFNAGGVNLEDAFNTYGDEVDEEDEEEEDETRFVEIDEEMLLTHLRTAFEQHLRASGKYPAGGDEEVDRQFAELLELAESQGGLEVPLFDLGDDEEDEEEEDEEDDEEEDEEDLDEEQSEEEDPDDFFSEGLEIDPDASGVDLLNQLLYKLALDPSKVGINVDAPAPYMLQEDEDSEGSEEEEDDDNIPELV